jgi:hypothetical protein
MVFLGNKKIPSLPTVQVGNRVTVQGISQNFNGQIQLGNIDQFVVKSSQIETPPTPITLKISDINTTKSPRAAQLEGVLVKIEQLVVVDANPDGPTNDYGEFSVAHSSATQDVIRIDDLFDTTAYTGSKVCGDSKGPNDTNCLPGDKCQCPLTTQCTTGQWRCYPPNGTATPDKRTKGDSFQSISGILLFTFGDYKIMPRTNADMPR